MSFSSSRSRASAVPKAKGPVFSEMRHTYVNADTQKFAALITEERSVPEIHEKLKTKVSKKVTKKMDKFMDPREVVPAPETLEDGQPMYAFGRRNSTARHPPFSEMRHTYGDADTMKFAALVTKTHSQDEPELRTQTTHSGSVDGGGSLTDGSTTTLPPTLARSPIKRQMVPKKTTSSALARPPPKSIPEEERKQHARANLLSQVFKKSGNAPSLSMVRASGSTVKPTPPQALKGTKEANPHGPRRYTVLQLDTDAPSTVDSTGVIKLIDELEASRTSRTDPYTRASQGNAQTQQDQLKSQTARDVTEWERFKSEMEESISGISLGESDISRSLSRPLSASVAQGDRVDPINFDVSGLSDELSALTVQHNLQPFSPAQSTSLHDAANQQSPPPGRLLDSMGMEDSLKMSFIGPRHGGSNCTGSRGNEDSGTAALEDSFTMSAPATTVSVLSKSTTLPTPGPRTQYLAASQREQRDAARRRKFFASVPAASSQSGSGAPWMSQGGVDGDESLFTEISYDVDHMPDETVGSFDGSVMPFGSSAGSVELPTKASGSSFRNGSYISARELESESTYTSGPYLSENEQRRKDARESRAKFLHGPFITTFGTAPKTANHAAWGKDAPKMYLDAHGPYIAADPKNRGLTGIRPYDWILFKEEEKSKWVAGPWRHTAPPKRPARKPGEREEVMPPPLLTDRSRGKGPKPGGWGQ